MGVGVACENCTSPTSSVGCADTGRLRPAIPRGRLRGSLGGRTSYLLTINVAIGRSREFGLWQESVNKAFSKWEKVARASKTDFLLLRACERRMRLSGAYPLVKRFFVLDVFLLLAKANNYSPFCFLLGGLSFAKARNHSPFIFLLRTVSSKRFSLHFTEEILFISQTRRLCQGPVHFSFANFSFYQKKS